MQIASKGLKAGHFKIIDGKLPQWTNRLDQSSYERPSKNWEHWQSDVGIFRSEAKIKKKENFVASIQAFCALFISYLVHREINLYSSHDAYPATAYSCYVAWSDEKYCNSPLGRNARPWHVPPLLPPPNPLLSISSGFSVSSPVPISTPRWSEALWG